MSAVPPIGTIEASADLEEVFLLMTDDAAQWPLRLDDCGTPAWSVLADGTDDAIRNAVAAARDTGSARDNVTIVGAH